MDLFGRKAKKEIARLQKMVEHYEEVIIDMDRELLESKDLVTKYSIAFNKIHRLFHELHDGADTDGDEIIMTEAELDKEAAEEMKYIDTMSTAYDILTSNQIKSNIG